MYAENPSATLALNDNLPEICADYERGADPAPFMAAVQAGIRAGIGRPVGPVTSILRLKSISKEVLFSYHFCPAWRKAERADTTEASVRLRTAREQLRQFARQTGLDLDSNRIGVSGFGRSRRAGRQQERKNKGISLLSTQSYLRCSSVVYWAPLTRMAGIQTLTLYAGWIKSCTGW